MSALRAPTLVIGLAAIFFAQTLLAQQPERKLEPARFRAVDIYLDSKSTPLAAYQLEFTVTNVVTRIVGIEGGEPGAFGEPPFYDPKAMQHERVILAAFSTASSDKLPKGQVRVATIHIRTEGSEEPQVELKIQTAADAAGKPILVEANYQERKG